MFCSSLEDVHMPKIKCPDCGTAVCKDTVQRISNNIQFNNFGFYNIFLLSYFIVIYPLNPPIVELGKTQEDL